LKDLFVDLLWALSTKITMSTL